MAREKEQDKAAHTEIQDGKGKSEQKNERKGKRNKARRKRKEPENSEGNTLQAVNGNTQSVQ